MKYFVGLSVVLSLLFLSAIPVVAQIQWPEGKKAAIALTYDDGIPTHFNVVMPQLEERGFRGTFYLIGNGLTEENIPGWRIAAEKGHELGNHSIFHPCLAGALQTEGRICRDLECYSVEEMLKEIALMNNYLFAIDGKKERSYAYPCVHTMAGGEDYSLPLIRSGLTRFARGGGNQVITNVKDITYENVPAFFALEGTDAETMIGYVKEVVAKGGLGVLLFHGVGGDYLSVDAGEHGKLLDYLKEHSGEIWVDTFYNILTHAHTLSTQK